jgi:hypothetical protein
MNALRELRRAIGLGRRALAALLSIPIETYRPWDSGRPVASAAVRQRAREAVMHHQRQHKLLPLDQLARELRRAPADTRTGGNVSEDSADAPLINRGKVIDERL